MAKKVLRFLFVFFLFTSCSRDNTSQYETNPVAEQVVDAASEVSFTSFSADLPVLPLPFTATCAFDYVIGPRLDTTIASSFLKPHELPYRRLPISQEVTALLVLFPTDETLPRLRTYSLSGEVLDEQDLKFAPCGEEPGFTHSEYYSIKKDFTIEHLDSTTRWQFDDQYQEKPGTRKLTVTKRQFKITPQGEIQEIL